MTIRKLCSKTGCHKLVNQEIKYCTKHEHLDKDRYKEYQKRRMLIEEQKKYQEFYNTEHWKRTRDAVIAELLGMDIYEYYTTGRIVAGQSVHHINELNEDWNSRNDILNLIFLTEKNHKRIHFAYEKSKKDKEKIKKKLFGLIKRFHQEFL